MGRPKPVMHNSPVVEVGAASYPYVHARLPAIPRGCADTNDQIARVARETFCQAQNRDDPEASAASFDMADCRVMQANQLGQLLLRET